MQINFFHWINIHGLTIHLSRLLLNKILSHRVMGFANLSKCLTTLLMAQKGKYVRNFIQCVCQYFKIQIIHICGEKGFCLPSEKVLKCCLHNESSDRFTSLQGTKKNTQKTCDRPNFEGF